MCKQTCCYYHATVSSRIGVSSSGIAGARIIGMVFSVSVLKYHLPALYSAAFIRFILICIAGRSWCLTSAYNDGTSRRVTKNRRSLWGLLYIVKMIFFFKQQCGCLVIVAVAEG